MALLRKFAAARKGAYETKEEFAALCQMGVVTQFRSDWDALEKAAKDARLDDMQNAKKMDIYDVAENEGTSGSAVRWDTCWLVKYTAPSQADYVLQHTTAETNETTGITAWISEGLKIEETQ